MRHGLLARIIILPNEDKENFETLFNLHAEKFSLVDDVEMSMIEEMCASYWRLRRSWDIENDILKTGITAHSDGCPRPKCQLLLRRGRKPAPPPAPRPDFGTRSPRSGHPKFPAIRPNP